MITKDERRRLLAVTVPGGLAVLATLPFMESRWALAVAGLALALAATIAGMAFAAPVQPNRKDAP